MNTACIKFHQIIFLLGKKYCQQKCTNYGYLWLYRWQISTFSFAGFAGLLCRRQSAKASKTFAAGKSFAGAMYNFNQFQGENGGEKTMGGKPQGVW